mgnify:CR=1 FL=1|jgi:hypothetical protein
MKIRVNQNTTIDAIFDKLYPRIIDIKKENEIRSIVDNLILQEKEFLILNVSKYRLSEFIAIDNEKIILYIRSDNILDKIKKRLEKYV